MVNADWWHSPPRHTQTRTHPTNHTHPHTHRLPIHLHWTVRMENSRGHKQARSTFQIIVTVIIRVCCKVVVVAVVRVVVVVVVVKVLFWLALFQSSLKASVTMFWWLYCFSLRENGCSSNVTKGHRWLIPSIIKMIIKINDEAPDTFFSLFAEIMWELECHVQSMALANTMWRHRRTI